MADLGRRTAFRALNCFLAARYRTSESATSAARLKKQVSGRKRRFIPDPGEPGGTNRDRMIRMAELHGGYHTAFSHCHVSP
jgi:hypothetical protein